MGALILSDESILLDAETKAAAQDAIAQVGDESGILLTIQVGGRSIPVGEDASALIMHLLAQAAQGNRVTMQSFPEQLTTTAAAQLLGVSRPTLMKKIANGEIASIMVGSHHRIEFTELQAFRERRRVQRNAAIEELRSVSDELGEF